MKAVYIEEPGKIVIKEREKPRLTTPDDVIIRVKYTGICGSDVHILRGDNAFAIYPRIFGHEFTGEVCEIGSGVTQVRVGDHVVGEPIEFCGTCYACRVGHPNVCEHLRVYGVHIDGGCQTYVKMPQRNVHRISPNVPWKCAVLAEPLTIGFRSCNRADVLPGDYVLIQGSGTIGLCCMLAAKKRGATVIMTDLFDGKLAYAKELGADYGLNAGSCDIYQKVMEITGGMGPNVIIDGVGSKGSLENAMDLISAAGRIVELGMSTVCSEISHVKLCRRDVSLLGTRLQAHEFPEAVSYLEKNWERMTGFVTGVFPIDRVQEAFDLCVNHQECARKVLIEV